VIYVYKINNEFNVGVIAENSTMARHGLDQKFPGVAVSYVAVLNEVFQVNGNMNMDSEIKVVNEESE
jgi:hypothetical protein